MPLSMVSMSEDTSSAKVAGKAATYSDPEAAQEFIPVSPLQIPVGAIVHETNGAADQNEDLSQELMDKPYH